MTDTKCPHKRLSGIYLDLHDLNTKQIDVSKDCTKMTITPFSAHQGSWSVESILDCMDYQNCNSTVNFNVVGKPNPPKQPVHALFSWSKGRTTLQFESDAGHVDNVWSKLS